LLVPDTKGHAKIADFAGTGDLSAWLRVASVRIALNLKRSKRREVDLDEDSRLADKAAGDLEIDHLKRRFRGEFKAAFVAAMAALEPRSRTLLRQHYLDGLTMDSIARVNQVHRITVVRWMEQARVALSRETRRELTARLRVGREELESILRLIDSQVHVTLSEVLRA
jgi:RNA polymerase sigma-70 factor (ECF subfamily)